MEIATAGTSEANDIMIALLACEPGSGLRIDLESRVYAQYGTAIREVIAATLGSRGIADMHVRAVDRGALDYTIRARVLAALDRVEMEAKKEGAR